MMNLFMGLGLYFMLLFFVIGLLLFIFWLWMFIEAIKNRNMLWIILLVVGIFTGILGIVFAVVYYFMEYKKKSVKKR